MIRGQLKITDTNEKIITKNGLTAFCRCGASKNKPFCDGSHQTVDFDE
ncbi:MAG: CDGSH iron-sulfur domain-containing protein [Lentimicrobiaceae bacterium]|nr:CDGSH iron-sulfur domain-containing protein [Lentimicrobiaceae bacterium]